MNNINFALFIDIMKAFDNVLYEKLTYSLSKHNIYKIVLK